MAGEDRLCPSTTLSHATHLLGVVAADGRVHFVSPPPPLDDDFRRTTPAYGTPEARFRFAGPCVEAACQAWTGTRCGVVDEVLEMSRDEGLDAGVRPCAIRQGCRWFAQRGAAACRVCTLVVTDTTEAAYR